MGAAVFMTENYITSPDQIAVTSERAGQVGLAVKVGQGSASLRAAGPYTGANPGQYIVTIDSVNAGDGIGQATFKWRPTSTTTWTAQGVATASTPVILEGGLTVAWSAGGGTELAVGDYWTITVDKPFGKAKLLDLDRDTEWRSEKSDSGWDSLAIDLGAARQVDAFALLDINIASTISLYMEGSADNFATQPYSVQVNSGTAWGNFVHFTTGAPTYRYWRIRWSNWNNTDGYARIGTLYLGSKTTLTRNFDRQWSRSPVAAIYGPTGALRTARGVWAEAEILDYAYRVMTEADRTAMVGIFRTMYSPAFGTVRPAIVNPDADTPADVSLYEFDSPELAITSPFVNFYEWQLRLRQRVRTARSGA